MGRTIRNLRTLADAGVMPNTVTTSSFFPLDNVGNNNETVKLTHEELSDILSQAPAAAKQLLTKSDAQKATYLLLNEVSSTGTTYTFTASPSINATYFTTSGLPFIIKTTTVNTGIVTLSIDGQSKSLKKSDGTDFASGEFKQGVYLIVYFQPEDEFRVVSENSELVKSTIGSILTDSVTIGLSYVAGFIVANIKPGSVTGAFLSTGSVTESKIAPDSITTLKVANNNITLPKLSQINNLRVLGNTSGSTANVSEVTVIDDDTFASATADNLATAESIKTYVDNAVAVTAQSLTYAPSIDVPIASTTKYLTLTLTGDAILTNVSGVTVGKEYFLYVDNNAPTVPHQITFNSTFFSLNDGVSPVLKSNTPGVLDIIRLVGITSTKLQIVDVIYGS